MTRYPMHVKEEEVFNIVLNNSIIFLKDLIKRLVAVPNIDTDGLPHEELLLCVCSIQISIELALKAAIIKSSGIRNILQTEFLGLSFQQLHELFLDNRLKIKSFEQLKVYSRNEGLFKNLDEHEFNLLTQFQKYRNGVVHSNYNFIDADTFDISQDILYLMISILMKMLSESKELEPQGFISVLGKEYKAKLIRFSPYIEAMKKAANDDSEMVLNCIDCNNQTYSADWKQCYCCGFSGELCGPLVKCMKCETKAIMYDDLNIEHNNNVANGLCLKCGRKTVIYKCTECGNVYDDYSYEIDKCRKDYCYME